MGNQFATIDEYVNSKPTAVQSVLIQVRETICAAAPGASERISYQMPTITLNGRDLVYFAAWKHHIALYPIPAAGVDKTLEREIAPYTAAKGTLRFPLARPVPYELIHRLVALRIEQREKTHEHPRFSRC